jgi:hypothetical protein
VSRQEGKGLVAVAIHDDLVATLGTDAISYKLSVCNSLPSRSETGHLQPREPYSKLNIEPDDCGEAILLALNEQSFSSIRQLARLTHLPRTTVHMRLTQPLGFQIRHLGWVPHRLSEIQQSNRVELSRIFVSLLTTQQERCWHDVLTLA